MKTNIENQPVVGSHRAIDPGGRYQGAPVSTAFGAWMNKCKVSRQIGSRNTACCQSQKQENMSCAMCLCGNQNKFWFFTIFICLKMQCLSCSECASCWHSVHDVNQYVSFWRHKSQKWKSSCVSTYLLRKHSCQFSHFAMSLSHASSVFVNGWHVSKSLVGVNMHTANLFTCVLDNFWI